MSDKRNPEGLSTHADNPAPPTQKKYRWRTQLKYMLPCALILSLFYLSCDSDDTPSPLSSIESGTAIAAKTTTGKVRAPADLATNVGLTEEPYRGAVGRHYVEHP